RMLGELGCGEEGCEDVQLSPDGQFAVWATKKQLWVAPVSEAGLAHPLTDLRGENFSPRWSPDGRPIAFVSSRSDHSFIGIYDFGRDAIRYLSPSVDRDRLPRWSPDGRHIAFVRIPGLLEKPALIPEIPVPWSIWVADATTGNAKEAWHSGSEVNDSYPELTADKSFYFPTNDRLLFASEKDCWNHLYSISASGGAATLLTPGNFEVEDVAVSRDRNSAIYSSNQNDVDRRHLWRVSLTDARPTALTHGETMEWTPVEVSSATVLCLGS